MKKKIKVLFSSCSIISVLLRFVFDFYVAFVVIRWSDACVHQVALVLIISETTMIIMSLETYSPTFAGRS